MKMVARIEETDGGTWDRHLGQLGRWLIHSVDGHKHQLLPSGCTYSIH